jgi:ribonuclease Z
MADTAPANCQAIIDIVRGADFFIAAAFAEADASLARERAHLTTRTAGEAPRRATNRAVPFVTTI